MLFFSIHSVYTDILADAVNWLLIYFCFIAISNQAKNILLEAADPKFILSVA